jgi:hypothetical protein
MSESSGESLKLLFSRFGDSAELVSPIKEAVRAHRAILDYGETGKAGYLSACLEHLDSALSVCGRNLGRFQYLKNGWTQELGGTYAMAVTNEKGKILYEFDHVANRMKRMLDKSDFEGAKMLPRRALDAFFREDFNPNTIFGKLGYVTEGLIRVANEIWWENFNRTRSNWPAYAYDEIVYRTEGPYADFVARVRREWMLHSGTSYQSTEFPENWTSQDFEWGEGDLGRLLERIDFNGKSIATAIVRIVGISVCIAGGAGKVASVLLVNPALNSISLNAMLAGGALAVSPSAAEKIAEKLGLH